MRDQDLEFSIVSGSDEELLFGCIESLARTMADSSFSWSVTVTSVAIGSALPNRLRKRYPRITVLENDTPTSLASSHNRVLRISRARYVWLLDPDLLILPNAVRRVAEFLDQAENARVGIASPQLLKADGALKVSSSSFPSMQRVFLTEIGVPSRYHEFIPSSYGRLGRVSARPTRVTSAVEVDTLARGCVAVRMTAFRQVGQMVDAPLPGSELPEWHRRFHEHGWKVVYLPDASVIHYGSQAARNGSRRLSPEYLKGALYFFRTGRSPATYLLFCTAMLGMFGLRAAYSWATRDLPRLNFARHSATIVWRELRENSKEFTPMKGAS